MNLNPVILRLSTLISITTFADVATPLVLPWYGYDLGHSLALMALMFMSEALIPVGAGIWLSSLTRNRSSGRLMRFGQGFRTIIFSSLVIAPILGQGWILWFMLVIGSGLNGLCSILSEASIQSAIPGNGSEITVNAGKLQRVNTLVKSAGIPMGAVMISFFGPSLTMIALAAGAGITGIMGPYWMPSKVPEAAPDAMTSDRWFGFRKLWSIPAIRSLSLQAMVGNFGYTIVMSGFLYYLLDGLSLVSLEVSVVYLIIAAGSALGSIIVVPLLRRFTRGQLYPAFLTGGFIGLMLLQIRTPMAAALGEGIVGLCDTAWVILSIGVRLELIRREDRAPVLVASRLISNSLVAVAGIIVAIWGLSLGFPALFGIGAAVKAMEAIMAKTTAVSGIDRGSCCAKTAMAQSAS